MNQRFPINPGLFLGVGAYLLWGLMPLYLRLLKDVPATQLLAHRVLWSAVLLLVVAGVFGRLRTIRAAATGRTLLLLTASAVLIAVNWLVYIWAVQSNRVLDASLGYFINPLVNVALGMAVLGERIRPVQGFAVALAAAGVAVMALGGGGGLWISLTLALSFGVYGLIRKTVAIDALGGLLVETLVLAPVAAVVLFLASAAGEAAFGNTARIDWLLVLAGAVTAAPLLLFAAAARRLRYATLGLLQYIGPTIQFGLAVFLFGERLRLTHIVTFGLIWAGCAIYGWDSWRGSREPAPAPA
jgi:chloramphenicol-sensitive protein RarD